MLHVLCKARRLPGRITPLTALQRPGYALRVIRQCWLHYSDEFGINTQVGDRTPPNRPLHNGADSRDSRSPPSAYCSNKARTVITLWLRISSGRGGVSYAMKAREQATLSYAIGCLRVRLTGGAGTWSSILRRELERQVYEGQAGARRGALYCLLRCVTYSTIRGHMPEDTRGGTETGRVKQRNILCADDEQERIGLRQDCARLHVSLATAMCFAVASTRVGGVFSRVVSIMIGESCIVHRLGSWVSGWCVGSSAALCLLSPGDVRGPGRLGGCILLVENYWMGVPGWSVKESKANVVRGLRY
ncbi:hypothetical protein Hypma_005706 [Hypsizygus marmoreus]|uniref:Uncharacterized protein n=1 Tax=Hypsizygus marmoreus TaxID=39966 RepID=A0A369JYS5_HYPMA|nr:hypothetical protein Hypma_005706 [Hypsizygus marmoreus]